MNDKEIFAKNLKMYMDLNGKDRNDICNALGFNYFTVTDWIKARKMPRMDKVRKLADYFGINLSDLVEEKVTEEMETKSDVAADITIRLGADVEFKNIVKRIYEDNDFFELNKMLCSLESEQLDGFKTMLSRFLK